jgi:hypothetical protein
MVSVNGRRTGPAVSACDRRVLPGQSAPVPIVIDDVSRIFVAHETLAPPMSKTPGPIPDDVKRFIVEHIDSVPALEALLLMRKNPERRWTAAMLTAELYMDSRQVEPLLAALCARGLCAAGTDTETTFFWRPATQDLAVALERLAAVYQWHLVPITNLIHQKPSASVRGFSDAFRLRGKE